jgi:hypothetical protein
MAVGYVERVGLGRETDCADEDLSIVSASIMENLRTVVCNFPLYDATFLTTSSLVLISRESPQRRRQGIT